MTKQGYVVIVLEAGAIASVIGYPRGAGDAAGQDYLGAKAEGLDVHLFLLAKPGTDVPAIELFPTLEVIA